MRSRAVACTLVAATGLLAVPAVAKEGVRAKLDAPVRLGAAPGERIRVTWRLVDQENHPFDASGIYLRVFRCGRKPLRVDPISRGRGRYSARVRVPKGGIRKLVVGLEGMRMFPSGRTERADAFFAFDPPLVRRCG